MFLNRRNCAYEHTVFYVAIKFVPSVVRPLTEYIKRASWGGHAIVFWSRQSIVLRFFQVKPRLQYRESCIRKGLKTIKYEAHLFIQLWSALLHMFLRTVNACTLRAVWSMVSTRIITLFFYPEINSVPLSCVYLRLNLVFAIPSYRESILPMPSHSVPTPYMRIILLS